MESPVVVAPKQSLTPSSRRETNNRRFSHRNETARRLAESRVFDAEKIEAGVRLMLEGMGESLGREGLVDTPSRVARMFEELVYGTDIDPATEVTVTFHENTNELVLVRDIAFSSICEHHLVPFIGVAHIGYIPRNGVITGLSKLARVVDLASKRLQVQERMTTQIAEALIKTLDPDGLVVLLEAEHLCMTIRGVKKAGSKTITSALRGSMATNEATRAEVMSLINCR